MLFLLLPAFAQPYQVSRDTYGRVAAAGDVNGDGFADVVVSNCATGVVDLYLGSSDGLVDSASVVTGGCELAGVGDLDGDGADEILVGDPDANGGDGVISLYRGAALTFWKRRYGSGGERLGEQDVPLGMDAADAEGCVKSRR